MPRISAIICVKDQKYELRKSLQSVNCQTDSPDEIIIVDGSRDDSVKNYVQGDLTGKTQYVLLDPQTAAGCDENQLLQIGLKHAGGDYAAFLLAGDEWNSEKVASVKAFALTDNAGSDFYISSFFQRVCLSNQEIRVGEIFPRMDGMTALFFLWFSPSAVVVRRSLAFALQALSTQEISALKVSILPRTLSMHYWGAQKNALIMEKVFWQKNCEKIFALGAFQKAALFCIGVFQNALISRESLETFANNVGLPLQFFFALTELLVEKNARAFESVLSKKQRHYIFVRNWLEMKIAGRSTAQNLEARGISSILIYGAGRHGTILFNELKNSAVKILGWIDKNPRSAEYLGLPVYGLGELRERRLQADSIVVTPFLEFDAIVSELQSFGYENFMPLNEIAI